MFENGKEFTCSADPRQAVAFWFQVVSEATYTTPHNRFSIHARVGQGEWQQVYWVHEHFQIGGPIGRAIASRYAIVERSMVPGSPA